MAPSLAPLLTLRHTFLYHQDGSGTTILLAALLNVVLPWLLFVAYFKAAERPGRLGVDLWTLLLCVLPWVLLRTYAVLSGWKLATLLSRIVLGLCVVALLGLLTAGRRPLVRHFGRVHEIAILLVAFLSISWILSLGQLAYYAWQDRGLNAYRSHAPDASAERVGAGQHARPLVVWILLDELAYDPVFGHRLAGLQLPAFDRLANEASVFTQASAPGIYTEEVVPQLLDGRQADDVTFTLKGQLQFHSATAPGWQNFKASDTVFSDARKRGYRTAVAGWHNPYCRLLGPVLDQCFWTSRMDSVTPEFDGDASFTQNLLGPVRRLLQVVRDAPSGKRTAQSDAEQYDALHIEDASALFGATDRMLADPSLNFVFLHIPLPHPSGIYDRKRHVTTNAGTASYDDNLAMADRYLAHVRALLEQRGEWDGAAVIVMGDHSWRTKLLWKGSRGWTPEDEVASHGGVFDPRPAVVVKLPHQQTGAEIDLPFSTLRSRPLVDAMMDGRVRTAEALRTWVGQR